MYTDNYKQHAHWNRDYVLTSFKSVKLLSQHSISDAALLQILGGYCSQRVRGEEEGRKGHGRGRGRRGQAGWDRDDGWSVRERTVTCSAHICCAGVNRGVEKHRGRVHGVCGKICRQRHEKLDTCWFFLNSEGDIFFLDISSEDRVKKNPTRHVSVSMANIHSIFTLTIVSLKEVLQHWEITLYDASRPVVLYSKWFPIDEKRLNVNDPSFLWMLLIEFIFQSVASFCL